MTVTFDRMSVAVHKPSGQRDRGAREQDPCNDYRGVAAKVVARIKHNRAQRLR